MTVYHMRGGNASPGARPMKITFRGRRDAILPTLLMQAQRESAETGREADLREIAGRYGFCY